MATNINSIFLDGIYIQNGLGIPTHLSPIGTVFVDTTAPKEYLSRGDGSWLDISSGGSGGTSVFTGGTVSGPTYFTNGLTANTISATTYYNLPIDVYITGATYSNGTAIFRNNTGGTFSVTGFSTGNTNSVSGAYLPLSGGTVTGGTVFTSGLTANTVNVTKYIDFNTGTTAPSNTSARVYYDNASHSLAYFSDIDQNVKVEVGQQLYIRGYNSTGSLIPKGSALSIQSATAGLPNFTLAVNTHVSNGQIIGLAASDIPNASNGLALSQGILSGLTVNAFNIGDILYASPFSAGTYVAGTSSFPFTARTNQIGYVITTGTSTGEIYVSINNEDENLTLTDIERNILEGNVISTGIYNYTGMTQGTGQTINIAAINGWIAYNTYTYATLPDVKEIIYTGGTNIPLTYLNSADSTYILINSASTIVQQTTFPTPQQRRENIFLGKVVHPNRATITSINQTVDFDVSPMAAIRDLWTPLKLINQGIIPSPNGVNLTINTSAGTLWGNGIGWVTNQLNPDSVSISGTSPTTFQYRTQLSPITGGTAPYTGNTTFIDPAHYDNNGVVTNVGGGPNSSTNQRIYIFPTGLVRIQYGQTVYSNLAAAVAGSQTESFVEYANNRDNGILIGILSVNKNATQLSNSAQAVFNLVSKFGELLGGTGGLSTTTLQQAYDNSTTPEIVINATLDGLSIKNGTGNADNVTHVLEGQNTAGATTSFITASGGFSANTISGTTYYNLPTNIFTTGATYVNNTFTYTNSTGGTFSVLFNTLTGLTVNGNLTVTGTTNISGATRITAGLTANTISATTYSNLPFWKLGSSGSYSLKANNDSSIDATGNYAYAEGTSTTASGNQSHAEGSGTTANGQSSHSEGQATTASGNYSHAEGYGTTASNQAAHAEGYQTKASSPYSHVEGYQSISTGNTSHAEGYQTTAGGSYTHAEGQNTIATGFGSHAEGGSSVASGDYSHAEGGGQATANYAHAEGGSTLASAFVSHAEGNGTTASNQAAHAEGYNTIASGLASHAEGSGTTASNGASHSEGWQTTASGLYSHAGGVKSVASGQTSFVYGSGSTAGGTGTIVLGTNLTGTTANTLYTNNIISTTISATTYYNLPATPFTGGTVTGPTNFTGGLTATSVTLPVDTFVTAPSATAMTWTVSGGSSNYQITLTATTTTINLINVRNGDYGTLIMTQGSGGSKVITLGTLNGSSTTHKVKNGGGGAIALSTAAGAIDIISFVYNGNSVFWDYGLNYT